MHRFSSPDPCHGSGPPDDPSDDGPDNDPGAPPHGGSDESDTAEKPLDSPPRPDHGPKTFFTVTDSLFTPAESLSASTSSTSILPAPRLSYNDSSNVISGSSTRQKPMGHILNETFQCMWGSSHGGLHCNDLFCGYNLSAHIREAHGIRGSDKSRVICMWDSCNVELSKESLSRHVEEKHLRIVYSCSECAGTYSRRDRLNRHRKEAHGLEFAS